MPVVQRGITLPVENNKKVKKYFNGMWEPFHCSLQQTAPGAAGSGELF